MTKISFIKLLNIFFKKNIKYKITKSYTKKKKKKIKKIKKTFFFFFFFFISLVHFCLIKKIMVIFVFLLVLKGY